MLTKEEVQKIARLGRLNLTEAEIEKFTRQLSAILGHAEMLKEVDTEGVEPISQITGLKNAHRKDEVISCEVADEMLKASPQPVTKRMIKVKNVFND